MAIENGYNSLVFLLDEPNHSTVYKCNLNFKKSSGLQKKLVEIAEEMIGNSNELILNQFEKFFFDRPPNKDDLEQYFMQKQVKFCPECIREDPFHRLHWDITNLTVCLSHGLMLLDHCPSCQKKISIFDLMVGFCRCSAYFEDAKSKVVLNSKLLEAQRITHSFLTGEKTEFKLDSGQKLNPREFFYSIHLISALLYHFDGDHPVFSQYPLPDGVAKYLIKGGEGRKIEMIASLQTAAYLILTQPEECFSKVLKTLEEMTTFPEKRFIYKRRLLRKLLNIKALDLHRSLYNEYLRDLTYVYPRRKNEITIPDSNYYTMRETLDFLSITYKQGVHLIESGLLEAHQRSRTVRMNTMIKKSDVHDWALKRKSLLTSEQVSESLGVHRLRVWELADSDILPALRSPKVDGFQKRLFEPQVVATFLQNLTAGAILLPKLTAEWKSFHDSLLHLHNSGFNAVELTRLLLTGGIRKAFVSKERTLGGILIHQEDVRRLIAKAKQKRVDEMGYTVKEISLMLNVGQRKVQRWIDAGTLHVAYKIPKGKSFSQYVLKQDVENLKNELTKNH